MRRDHGAVAPVVLDGDVPAWLVLGYRELHQVTGDPVLFSRDSELWNQWDRIPDDWPLLPMIGRRQNSILYTVGERHSVRAMMISNALEGVDPFSLKRYAEEFADELIDRFCTKGAVDIIAEYTKLLPALVLARIYGYPEEVIRPWSDRSTTSRTGWIGPSPGPSTWAWPPSNCWPRSTPSRATTSSAA